MTAADHCLKSLPRVTRDTAYLQVECPVCLSLWIYEKAQWTQMPYEERLRHGLVIAE